MTVLLVFRGRTGEKISPDPFQVLMESQVMVKSDEECKKMTESLMKYDPKSMICAYTEKTDACQVFHDS